MLVYSLRVMKHCKSRIRLLGLVSDRAGLVKYSIIFYFLALHCPAMLVCLPAIHFIDFDECQLLPAGG